MYSRVWNKVTSFFSAWGLLLTESRERPPLCSWGDWGRHGKNPPSRRDLCVHRPFPLSFCLSPALLRSLEGNSRQDPGCCKPRAQGLWVPSQTAIAPYPGSSPTAGSPPRVTKSNILVSLHQPLPDRLAQPLEWNRQLFIHHPPKPADQVRSPHFLQVSAITLPAQSTAAWQRQAADVKPGACAPQQHPQSHWPAAAESRCLNWTKRGLISHYCRQHNLCLFWKYLGISLIQQPPGSKRVVQFFSPIR